METFTAEQRRQIERETTGQGPLDCPVCGARLAVNDVPPSRQVSYVRRRVWVICPSCRRSAAVDVGGGPGAPVAG